MPTTSGCRICPSLPHSLFSVLPPQALTDLEEARTCRTFAKGEILFHEGGLPAGLHCIARGSVKLFKTTPEGTLHILRWVGEGELLGHRELHDEADYGYTAEAVVDSVVCHVERGTVLGLMDEHPRLLRAMARKLAADLGRAEDDVVKIGRTARQKVADLLLKLDITGPVEDADSAGGFLFSREEMSQIVGTTPETFARILTGFQQEGLITRTRRRIRVQDHQRLRSLAGLG